MSGDTNVTSSDANRLIPVDSLEDIIVEPSHHTMDGSVRPVSVVVSSKNIVSVREGSYCVSS